MDCNLKRTNQMIKRSVIAIVSLFLLSAQGTFAQEAWTLERCITYALENNITIKRQEISADMQANELQQSKLNQLPDFNAGSGYGVRFGETGVRNGSSYEFTTDPIHSLSIRAGGSVNLFSGLQQRNTIKKNEALLQSVLENTQYIRNNISLQIASQYLQVLFDKELLNVSMQQYELTQLQVERTQKLVDAGSQAMGSLLEIKSQAAKEALNVTQQENNLALSLLNLAQLLDLEDVEGFDVISPEIPAIEQLSLENPFVVYQTATGIMPQIKASEYNLESKKLDVQVAKSGFYPSLDLEYNWRTYANWYINDKYNSNVSFSDQNSDNQNTYVGLSLSIPIFNKFQNRNKVRRANINVLDAQYALDQEKLKLRKEIQQAYADAKAAYNKYVSSNEAVESYKESFRYTEQKFNVGLVNSVDYNVAKTDFTRAQSDLLQSRYEYILRNKILDFYKGIPIKL